MTATTNHKKLLRLFEQSLAKRGLCVSTVRSYLVDVGQYLKWLESNHAISAEQVDRSIAEAYLNHLQNETFELRPGKYGHYSPSTIKRKIKVLEQFYDTITKSFS